MNELLVDQLGNGYRFTLQQKKVNPLVKVILFLLTLITTSIPITVLFSSNASKGVIVGAILSAFCAAFLMRLSLWNFFGKEIIEIDKDTILHYIDYRFFKDELLKIENSNQIEFAYFNTQNLIGNTNKSPASFAFTISNKKGKLSQSNILLTEAQALEMVNRFEN